MPPIHRDVTTYKLAVFGAVLVFLVLYLDDVLYRAQARLFSRDTDTAPEGWTAGK